MAEGLWRWLSLAIDRELLDPLRLLAGLDGARRDLQEIVDMPDRLIVLLIKLCRANGGRLSKRKRERHAAQPRDRRRQPRRHAPLQHVRPAKAADDTPLEQPSSLSPWSWAGWRYTTTEPSALVRLVARRHMP